MGICACDPSTSGEHALNCPMRQVGSTVIGVGGLDTIQSLQGWQCPGCRIYHAPWIKSCDCAVVPVRIVGNTQLYK